MVANIVQNFIDGKIDGSVYPNTLNVVNPATGLPVHRVVDSESVHVQRAIAAAHAAFPAWAATSALKRSRILFKFKQLLEDNLHSLAHIITQEHGKTLSDSVGEITRGIEVVEFACGIPHLLKGDFSNNVGSGVDSHSLMQPIGVCVGITPFNFPAMVPMWMFPIAIAAGNTFILKPSEKVPSLALHLAKLLTQAGLPKGVFNVVNGGKNAVDVLITDPLVQAVSFVGSTPVAEYIYATASANGKRCQALGGAKNHAILMPDADLDMAAAAITAAAFGAAGERCMALSVVVAIGDKTADALINKLHPLMRNIRVGAGDKQEPENDMGPVISRAHLDKISAYIMSGEEQGAKILCDGRDIHVVGHENGFFIGPTLFDHVSPQMTIYQEEIFGPVLCLIRAPDFASALKLINDNPYGNGAVIFTRSGRAAREFCTHVTAGMVGVNIPVPVPMAFHCFGGWKRSIFGPLNVHGPDGVRFYTRMKTVTTRWPEGETQDNGFSMPTMK